MAAHEGAGKGGTVSASLFTLCPERHEDCARDTVRAVAARLEMIAQSLRAPGLTREGLAAVMVESKLESARLAVAINHLDCACAERLALQPALELWAARSGDSLTGREAA